MVHLVNERFSYFLLDKNPHKVIYSCCALLNSTQTSVGTHHYIGTYETDKLFFVSDSEGEA